MLCELDAIVSTIFFWSLYCFDFFLVAIIDCSDWDKCYHLYSNGKKVTIRSILVNNVYGQSCWRASIPFRFKKKPKEQKHKTTAERKIIYEKQFRHMYTIVTGLMILFVCECMYVLCVMRRRVIFMHCGELSDHEFN